MIQSDRDGTRWETNDVNSVQNNIEVATDASTLVDAFTRTPSKIKPQITNNEMKEIQNDDFKNDDDECAIPDLDDLNMKSSIMSINEIPIAARKLPTLKELVSFGVTNHWKRNELHSKCIEYYVVTSQHNLWFVSIVYVHRRTHTLDIPRQIGENG